MRYGDEFKGLKKATGATKDLKKLMRQAGESIASVIDIPEFSGIKRKDLDIDDTPEQSLIDNIKGYADVINQPAIARNLGELKRLLQEMRVAITTSDKSNLPDPFEAESNESTTPLHGLISTLDKQFTDCGHNLENAKNITDRAIADLIQKVDRIDSLSQQIAQGLKEKDVGTRRAQ